VFELPILWEYKVSRVFEGGLHGWEKEISKILCDSPSCFPGASGKFAKIKSATRPEWNKKKEKMNIANKRSTLFRH
jgi:hypothetical protein